jgi:hypothetical protein
VPETQRFDVVKEVCELCIGNIDFNRYSLFSKVTASFRTMKYDTCIVDDYVYLTILSLHCTRKHTLKFYVLKVI